MNIWFDYIQNMIYTAGGLQSDIMDFVLNGETKNDLPLLKIIENISAEISSETPPTYIEAYDTILDSVIVYLKHMEELNSPISFKLKFYDAIVNWCKHLIQVYEIPDYHTRLSELQEPIYKDTTVCLVKELHDRKGKTKKELIDALSPSPNKLITAKTIQNNLNRLSGNSGEPLRLGGQPVCVKVEVVKKDRWADNGFSVDSILDQNNSENDRQRRYYTPNTMHPLIFQMNLTQVATLLQSLQYNYRELGNQLPLDLAVDTWCQLTDYAKGKIMNVFGARDPSLMEFIEEVETAAKTPSYRFMEESKLLENPNLAPNEQLDNVFKRGAVCDIELGNPVRTRKSQRIVFDSETESYYAVSAHSPQSERLYFNENDLISLTPASKHGN